MLNHPSGGYPASYPSKIISGAGLRASTSGLALRLALDYSNLPLLTNAPAAGHVLVQDPETGASNRLDLSNLPTTVPQMGSVSNDKFSAVPPQTLKGNVTGATAQPQDVPISAFTEPGNPVGDAIAGAARRNANLTDLADVNAARDAINAVSTTLTAVGRRRARSTVNKVGERASVLDYIDSQFHAAIRARTATQDVGPDILKAIQDAEDGNGAEVFVPAGVYPTAIPLFNGNGSTTAGSTKSGVLLVGETCRFYGLGGTEIKAIAAMPTLYEMRGPIDGGGFRNIRWDCNALADRGFAGLGLSSAEMTQFVITQFRRRGFELLGRGPAGSAGWCASNDVRGFFITSTVVQDGAIGFRLSGDITNVLDPHRNTFSLGIIQIPRGQTLPNYAVEYGFCDSNTFTEIDYSVYGPGLGGDLHRTDADNPGFPYPQHNKHVGCSIPLIVTDGAVGTDEFYGHPTADNEKIPDAPTIIGATDQGESFANLRVRKTLPRLDLSTADGLKKLRLQQNANNSGYFDSSLERTADGINFIKLLGFNTTDLVSVLKGFAIDVSIQKTFGSLVFRTPGGASYFRIQHNANETTNLGFFIQNSADGVTWNSLLRIGPDGLTAVLFAGVGLRTLTAGAAGSGGTGKRLLLIDD